MTSTDGIELYYADPGGTSSSPIVQYVKSWKKAREELVNREQGFDEGIVAWV